MTSAAKFDRRTVFDYTHVVSVFLTEECHSTHCLGFRYRSMTALFERQVLTYHLIGYFLHLAQFLRSHFLEMAEVETQTVCSHQTTLLLHVLA